MAYSKPASHTRQSSAGGPGLPAAPRAGSVQPLPPPRAVSVRSPPPSPRPPTHGRGQQDTQRRGADSDQRVPRQATRRPIHACRCGGLASRALSSLAGLTQSWRAVGLADIFLERGREGASGREEGRQCMCASLSLSLSHTHTISLRIPFPHGPLECRSRRRRRLSSFRPFEASKGAVAQPPSCGRSMGCTLRCCDHRSTVTRITGVP